MKRFSNLQYVGKTKLIRMPRRSAIISFSINDVYEIAPYSTGLIDFTIPYEEADDYLVFKGFR